MTFDGNLWPGEEAWKMRIEFSRTADFAPDEILTFKDITVPGATQAIELDDTTNIGGTELRLETICGTEAKLPARMQWATESGYINFTIQAKPWTKGERLTLLKIVDDAGREMEVLPHDDWDFGEWVYAFKAPEGAKRLNFTFALHKSRFVEFTAKPEFVKAAERR